MQTRSYSSFKVKMTAPSGAVYVLATNGWQVDKPGAAAREAIVFLARDVAEREAANQRVRHPHATISVTPNFTTINL